MVELVDTRDLKSREFLILVWVRFPLAAPSRRKRFHACGDFLQAVASDLLQLVGNCTMQRYFAMFVPTRESVGQKSMIAFAEEMLEV